MKHCDNKTYYKEFHCVKQNHNKFKYRLTYVGNYLYQLTEGKYKVLKHSCSFRQIYIYCKENHISFSEVHMPYITLYEFLKYWVTFD